MSNDKRTVMTDALETLGAIITENEKRDAIHLAVEPVIAGARLYPGQDIGLLDGKALPAKVGQAIAGVEALGIVDPFLKAPVNEGERFWLVVYPRQINSLRHVWTHPAFPDEQGLSGKSAASEKWLRDYANTIPVSYEGLIYHAGEWVKHGNYWIEGGSFEGEYIPDEFWPHYEAVTGETVPEHSRENFFSCSC